MKIGFMQGRLCDPVNNLIQAFPKLDWKTEFSLANQIGIGLMEWTLDNDGLYQNPLMTNSGRREISELSREFSVEILSLTGDCFMQAPFFKSDYEQRKSRLIDLEKIIQAAAELGIRHVLIPLVDNSALQTPDQLDNLFDGVIPFDSFLRKQKMKILFESDFSPLNLKELIRRFPVDTFGINYDIGNSAALGYKVEEEFASYGIRIDNVHVKDRIFGGTTVPLGTGNANFSAVFKNLHKTNYKGNLILQTARSINGDHVGAIYKYFNMTTAWWLEHGS